MHISDLDATGTRDSREGRQKRINKVQGHIARVAQPAPRNAAQDVQVCTVLLKTKRRLALSCGFCPTLERTAEQSLPEDSCVTAFGC